MLAVARRQKHDTEHPDGAIPCQLDAAEAPGGYTLRVRGRTYDMRVAVGPDATFVHLNGQTFAIGRVDPAERLAGNDGGAVDDRIVAPMPGVVVSVNAKVWLIRSRKVSRCWSSKV